MGIKCARMGKGWRRLTWCDVGTRLSTRKNLYATAFNSTQQIWLASIDSFVCDERSLMQLIQWP